MKEQKKATCCFLSLSTAVSVHCTKSCIYSQKCPWGWAKLLPETCTADFHKDAAVKLRKGAGASRASIFWISGVKGRVRIEFIHMSLTGITNGAWILWQEIENFPGNKAHKSWILYPVTCTYASTTWMELCNTAHSWSHTLNVEQTSFQRCVDSPFMFTPANWYIQTKELLWLTRSLGHKTRQLKRRDYFWPLGLDKSIILKWTFKKTIQACEFDIFGAR
jgi:hypothetical protein